MYPGIGEVSHQLQVGERLREGGEREGKRVGPELRKKRGRDRRRDEKESWNNFFTLPPLIVCYMTNHVHSAPQ